LLPFRDFAQNVAELLKQGDQLEASFRENDALAKYAEVARLDPRNITALCKCSELCCRIGNRQSTKEKKLVYFRQGRTYADAAYRVNPNSSESNIVMAFSLARMAIVEGSKEKVASAGVIKQYAEKAIRADPTNFKSYHILGRWHYEISNLNALERTFAKWFVGPLPQASLEECIRNFEKSKALAPGFIPNYLELAKAYKRADQKARALQLLRQMATLPDKMEDDSRAKAEGRKLLEEWQ
jgi:hypothetical protein